MKFYEFSVPLPPSDNTLFANCKKGQTFTNRWETKESKSFKREAGFCFMQAKLPRNKVRRAWTLDLSVYMDTRPYAMRDLSNCFKALIDALSEYIGSDDRFLMELNTRKILRKGQSVINGTLTIEDEEMP